jgi:hypothetical protein
MRFFFDAIKFRRHPQDEVFLNAMSNLSSY